MQHRTVTSPIIINVEHNPSIWGSLEYSLPLAQLLQTHYVLSLPRLEAKIATINQYHFN